MRMPCAILLAATALAAADLATGARAQLPFPFDPAPEFMRPPQCTRSYLRSIQDQAAALERLRTEGPEAIGRFCALIEFGSSWLGNKLPDDKRKELRGLLGIDVDLDRLAAQCRTGQDAIARELAVMLRHAKAELLRCDDTI
ncbi:MAG: hypothetical protein J2P50_14300 [Hyphomicrobiaceae bacterium]|nr:hypothetical protein [Hyphomicrobiaceae bacterium]